VVQFKKLLGLDTVLLGFGLPDENAHAPNEFINLDNFFGGIRTSIHFYNELPSYWGKQGKKK
jgi:acetylornithine deacetylase/succinyl-diaminopimelate desuccinylase-like protein